MTPDVEAARLTGEDRLSLGRAMYGRDHAYQLNGPIPEAVERILARHVAEAEARGGREALAEAADEIEHIFREPCVHADHPGTRCEPLVGPSWLRARAQGVRDA